ncbi:hypothetical protein PRUPE_3G229900 [Prunus persica]|uniref:Wound-responsive family protein n=1 Tax=Prunus persica TaxID=3760 RepID=A0A251Q489_PRUPE|nr:uncharacterized protein LOC18784340 [Prunus persica]ONI18649.1 hypothetical protein PRUPE_3G229900 [Prunus persica]
MAFFSPHFMGLSFSVTLPPYKSNTNSPFTSSKFKHIKTSVLLPIKFKSVLIKFTEEDINMSSSSSPAARRGWVVAASVGVVEALKDQGICRWNYTMRLMQQHAKSQLGSFSQANKLSSSSSALVSSKLRDEKVKQSEESLRKVMYLSCWGPN